MKSEIMLKLCRIGSITATVSGLLVTSLALGYVAGDCLGSDPAPAPDYLLNAVQDAACTLPSALGALGIAVSGGVVSVLGGLGIWSTHRALERRERSLLHDENTDPARLPVSVNSETDPLLDV